LSARQAIVGIELDVVALVRCRGGQMPGAGSVPCFQRSVEVTLRLLTFRLCLVVDRCQFFLCATTTLCTFKVSSGVVSALLGFVQRRLRRFEIVPVVTLVILDGAPDGVAGLGPNGVGVGGSGCARLL